MENRFGVKDAILFTLVAILLLVAVLAMFQYDRQWEMIRDISRKIDAQRQELLDIRETLARGVVAVGPTTNTTTTQQAADPSDPFVRIRTARAMPGYAKGDWIVDAFGNSVGKLTPLLSGDAYASTVQSFVLESLADRDPDTLEWRPLLCRSWKIIDNSKAYEDAVAKLKAAGRKEEEIAKDPSVPDALSITFAMRQGPRFSDGKPVTADDVVFSYSFPMDPKINCPREKAYYSRIRSVTKTDDDQVRFTFREPYFQAFELAAGMPVLPKHFYGKFEAEKFNQSVGYLMGSGPYRMPDPESWKPGTLIQLVRNEQYWGVQPAIDKLIWKEISNDIAHQAAFRNQDIDAFGATPEQYREMIKDQSLLDRTQHFEYQNPVGGYRYIAWNQRRDGKATFFADKRVRQAMTLLLDRQRMIQEIMLGYAVLSTGPFNPASQQYNKAVQPWPYDVARAKAMLKEAGFVDRDGDEVLESADGKPFTFKLTYPSGSANYEKMVLFLKDSLARAGVALQPDPLDWSVLVERLNKKNFDAVTLGWTAGIESDIFQMFHSSQAVEEGDNFMNYRNEELDRLISEARTMVDDARRLPLWQKAHAIIHEDQPYTFLSFGKSLVFFDNRIRNVQVTRLGITAGQRAEWFVPVDRQRWTK